MAYASVPLYDLFCRVTGYGGTTQIAENVNEDVIYDHPVKVRFDANVNPALNWSFVPVDKPVTDESRRRNCDQLPGNKSG
jgi:cytochrome c oxidase assembly protein subunit 11